MDEITLQTFKEFWVTSTPSSARYLPHLTSEELSLFQHLAQENIRLEQEHISHIYAVKRLYESLQIYTS